MPKKNKTEKETGHSSQPEQMDVSSDTSSGLLTDFSDEAVQQRIRERACGVKLPS